MSKRYKTAAEQRKGLKRINVTSLMKKVSRRTGYLQKDVMEVYNTIIDIVADEILEERKCIEIRKLGMIYPLLQKERQGNTFKDGNCIPTTIPARWVLKFRPNQYLREGLKQFEPTEEEVEAQFINVEE